VRVSVQDNNRPGLWKTLKGSPEVIGPCMVPEPTCAGFTQPEDLDPNTPYKITARVDYGKAAVAQEMLNQVGDLSFYLKVNGPNVGYDNEHEHIRHDPGSSILYVTHSFSATHNTGTYVVAWGIHDGDNIGTIDCGGNGNVRPHPGQPPNHNPATFPVTNLPYFNVTGGDIATGAGMSTGSAGGAGSPAGGSSCAVSADSEAGVVSWNRGASGGYGGAGTNYAALALNHLQGFVSGQGSHYQPSGLALANTGTDAKGHSIVQLNNSLYGGGFGGLSCVPDYYAHATNPKPNGFHLNPGSLAAYGAQASGGKAVIPNGKHITVYVDGDAYIDSNILFGGSASGYGSSLSDIPSFVLVAKGNIYISPSVTRLDGLYVAEPRGGSGSDGVIYDCSQGSSPVPFSSSHYYATCKKPLDVYGAFISGQLWLQRTGGTYTTGQAAESFHFSPEVWIGAPFNSQLNGGVNETYDAITSLPPVL
jgi:hypothetical protein